MHGKHKSSHQERQLAVKVAVDYISFPFEVEYPLHGSLTVDYMVVEWVMMVVEQAMMVVVE